MNHRALKIDATTGIVSEVRIKDYTDISKHIGCQCFTAVSLGKGETLYVDDEGLINGTTKGFTVAYGDGMLMGNGLILGSTPDGDSCDTKLNAYQLVHDYCIDEVFDIETGERTDITSASSHN